jgi:hypothetical protein
MINSSDQIRRFASPLQLNWRSIHFESLAVSGDSHSAERHCFSGAEKTNGEDAGPHST